METLASQRAATIDHAQPRAPGTKAESTRGSGRVYKRGTTYWIAYYAPRDGRSVEHRELGGVTEKEAVEN